MPGTIQVSVLDFMGIHSSVPQSQMCIKVSLGKKEYITWNKGDLFFPVTTLRNDLVVTLQDAEGNEISHTGVQTKLVIEKGFWDDIFPLEGGGYVHMKLLFVLNDEDRNRIRMMREAALKRKQDKLLNSSERELKNGPAVAQLHPEVSDSRRLLPVEVATIREVSTGYDLATNSLNLKDQKAGNKKSEVSHSHQKKTIPNDTDRSEETSLPAPASVGVGGHLTDVSHKDLLEKTEVPLTAGDGDVSSEEALSSLGHSGSATAASNKSIPPNTEDVTHDSEKQTPAEKTPSNVRKMISAFEGSRTQDMRPSVRSPPPVNIRARGEQIGFIRGLDWAKSSKDTGKLNELSTLTQSTGTNPSLKIKLEVFEGPTVSGRMPTEHVAVHQASNLSTDKLKLVSNNEGYQWILSDEEQHLCITTGDKRVMDLMGGWQTEAKAHHHGKTSFRASDKVEENPMQSGSDVNVNKGEKTSPGLRQSKLESSADDDTSSGLVGQTIKVAIMTAFGILVLLTRQRKNR